MREWRFGQTPATRYEYEWQITFDSEFLKLDLSINPKQPSIDDWAWSWSPRSTGKTKIEVYDDPNCRRTAYPCGMSGFSDTLIVEILP
ncbi:MAG: hypothetical protein HZB51_04975 [Chloroflexi bacterium]|nr:hypothetical protein [Chloroflexota bacterium]